MTEKYKNKYRIPSARLQNWDYGWNATYFVTICTQHREHYFGYIVETQNLATPYKMQLSEIGLLAHKYWMEIPQHFPFVKLGAFVVMPNHVHGIVIIDKPDDGRDGGNGRNVAETQDFASLLASIIRGYKIGVTKNARQIHADFAWQSRFHDHIIRNDKSFRNTLLTTPKIGKKTNSIPI